MRKPWFLVSLLALAVVGSSTVFADGDSLLKTRQVPDGKGGFRVEVVDRPSNATPGANELARQRAAERKNDAQAADDITTLAAGTDNYPPTTIRVGIRPNNDRNADIANIQTITFYDSSGTNDYVQNVLPHEWPCLWNAEAVKAGAIAVKMYGWYHTMYPKYPAIGADVDNTVNSQKYLPNSAHPTCTSAIRTVDHEGFRRYYQGFQENPWVFETAYCAGEYRDDKDLPCVSYVVGETMSQNGSSWWADQGRTYRWIVDYYYDPPTFKDTQGFFNY